MKKILKLLMVAVGCAGSLCYADPSPEQQASMAQKREAQEAKKEAKKEAQAAKKAAHQLAKMAQKGSGVSFDTLCVAVYEAVKADPNNAVDIFKTVMTQRDTWSATETYSVLRSVLLAAPVLEEGFVANAQSYNNNPGSYIPVAVESAGYQLLATLYTMPQTQPVAGTVAQGVAATTITGATAGNGVSSDSMESFVPNAPSTTPEEISPVTPPAVSSPN